MSSYDDTISQRMTNQALLASNWLKQGKLLAYPTESIWGIGCDPFNKQAVDDLLALKNRPMHKGLIVITDTIERIENFLLHLPKCRQDEIQQSWQADIKQATTWLFDVNHLPLTMPAWIIGRHHSLAIRKIAHPAIAELCALMNNPYRFLVSTSCNPDGELPAHDLTKAIEYFGKEIYYFKQDTLGLEAPSQIRHSLTGQVVRI